MRAQYVDWQLQLINMHFPFDSAEQAALLSVQLTVLACLNINMTVH